ncbi:TetR/AcrR family transcriptional regulator [Kordiimonas pumila]|nr:TetR/AcrR family transcriptional regulator [Kordiimonas pumila]
MARPQSADYDTRKQKILETAANVFAVEGYHKASISGIAAKCGISKALIYHYYPSKEDMLYHAMLDHVRELEASATSLMQEDLPPAETLRKIIRDYLIIYERTVDCHHLLVNELGSLPPERKKEVVEIQNRVVHAFAELADRIAPSDLNIHKAKSVVSMLMLGMINWTYLWFKPSGSLSSEKLADMIADILLNGLNGLTDTDTKI